MAAQVRAYRPADAAALVRGIREIDRIEVQAMTGRDPSVEGMADLARRSRRVSTITDGEEVIGIFGVSVETLLSDVGNPWLLGTDAMTDKRLRRAFIRGGPAELARIGEGFRALWNAASADNRVTLRWLEWLGFEILYHSAEDVRGVTFIPFMMEV